MYLLDTNIFLEIFLSQNKKDLWKKFINNNLGNVFISDFTWHTLGIILLKYKKYDIFLKFLDDIIDAIKIIYLHLNFYKELPSVSKELNLNFDDVYQYIIAKYYNLIIVTMDKDFEKIKDIEIIFI